MRCQRRQVKFAKRAPKNEVKLRWSVWPQRIHGLCRLWKQNSPRRIPCDTLSPGEHEVFRASSIGNIKSQRILQSVFKTLNRFRKALGIGVHIEWGCGSNENANRLIRRWFPKGTDFSKVTAAQIAALQDWINNYPRKVLSWATSNTVYELYMQQQE